MEVLTYPNVIPNSMSLNLVSNTVAFTSPFTQAVTTHNFTGARWVATLNYNSLDNYDSNDLSELQTFIWSLQGMNGRFKMWNFSNKGRPPVGSATPWTMEGIYHSGSTLATHGWRKNSIALRKGEHFEWRGELKLITEDIWADESGYAVLKFIPPIRKAHRGWSQIFIDKPMGTFRLADNEQGMFELTAGIEASLTLNVVEAF